MDETIILLFKELTTNVYMYAKVHMCTHTHTYVYMCLCVCTLRCVCVCVLTYYILSVLMILRTKTSLNTFRVPTNNLLFNNKGLTLSQRV